MPLEILDIRYATALASIKLVKDGSLLALAEEDLEFLMSKTPWINTDRVRARRCIEAAVYGSIDYLGLPREDVPAEFIAGVIAYFVHPVNTQLACHYMKGCEFSEHIIAGVEQRVSEKVLFSCVLRIKAGIEEDMEKRLEFMKTKISAGLL